LTLKSKSTWAKNWLASSLCIFACICSLIQTTKYFFKSSTASKKSLSSSRKTNLVICCSTYLSRTTLPSRSSSSRLKALRSSTKNVRKKCRVKIKAKYLRTSQRCRCVTCQEATCRISWKAKPWWRTYSSFSLRTTRRIRRTSQVLSTM